MSEYHDDKTLEKVAKVLKLHLRDDTEQGVIDCISALQNEGILFREQIKEPTITPGVQTHQFIANPLEDAYCVCGAPWNVPVHK